MFFLAATLVGWIGGDFVYRKVADEEHISLFVCTCRANDSVVLALYEAIHLNRNFITTLTHVCRCVSDPQCFAFIEN